MGRKCIEVKSLYELSIDDLNLIANNSESNYTRDFVKAVVMRYNGVHPQVIADTLSKSRATVISYINEWNNYGIASIADHRGNNIPSSLTDEMVEFVRDAVANKKPQEFGFEQNKWSSDLVSRLIDDEYGKKFSKTWMKMLLRNIGFSYKRGVYKPTLSDPELQEGFKKNEICIGYY